MWCLYPGALVGIAALAATLGGCGRENAAAPARKSDAAPRQVRVVPAAESRVPRTVSTTGTLVVQDQVVLGAKVTGRLSEITVDLGSPVRKGQAVARIDAIDYRLRVAQAEAALQQARARLGLPADGTSDRIEPERTALVRQAAAVLEEARRTRERAAQLWDRQLISRAEVDTAVSQLAVAEGRYQDAIEEVRNRQAVLAQRRSELELARQQLADTVLVSPIDGAVSQRQASVGEYLSEAAPVLTVVRTHPLRLRLAVPERDVPAVRVGQTVRLTVEGDPTVYGGRVARLSPAISEQNRTLLVEAEVPNERALLRAGSFTKAEIVVAADQAIITVPASAIVTFAGIEKVLTVADGKTVEKRVVTGSRHGDAVEIASGLTAGELVVAQPGNLVGGQPVTAVR
ncbi:MAG TPA: efflux RND transporter periplasmic adaptor subunit [Methylomirabilota bacterium]|jgi:RND family efflux transporter MFP subunit|nr:efflux RND transporter periplasmic adaptor subunit [Methylomirabilota bacterium]